MNAARRAPLAVQVIARLVTALLLGVAFVLVHLAPLAAAVVLFGVWLFIVARRPQPSRQVADTRTDRDTSQIAADASSQSIHETRRRVLEIVAQEGPIIGAQINDLYDLRRAVNGWRDIHIDSPRKRAGELAADGYLEVVGDAVNPKNHLPEAQYAITDAGRRLIGVAA